MRSTSHNTFSPNVYVTRADFATALGRMYEMTGGTIRWGNDHAFTDVIYGAYYFRYVQWASYRGVINGIGNNLFAPGDLVTREQMATMLLRYRRYVDEENPEINFNTLESFPDHGSVADWAREGMAWTTDVGLIQGFETGLIVPLANARREQIAVILHRYVTKITPLAITGHTVLGDVTGSGTVGIEDLELLYAYLAGDPVMINRFGADVNGDGVIDFEDFILLQRFLGGENVFLGPQGVMPAPEAMYVNVYFELWWTELWWWDILIKCPDDTTQLIATVYPLDADQTVIWSSCNPNLLNVTQTGLVYFPLFDCGCGDWLCNCLRMFNGQGVTITATTANGIIGYHNIYISSGITPPKLIG